MLSLKKRKKENKIRNGERKKKQVCKKKNKQKSEQRENMNSMITCLSLRTGVIPLGRQQK